MEISDEAYKKLVLEVAAARGMGDARPRKRFSLGGCVVWALCGIMFVVFVVALIPNIVASYAGLLPPSLSGLLATPKATFSTRQETPRPPALPMEGGAGAPAWPTLTPEPQGTAAPALTIPPVPTEAPSFWTEEEKAAFTATAVSFYDASTLPIAPPAFVEAVEGACADPERVAESATLQLFCKK